MRHEWPWGLRDGLSFESPGFNSQGWIIKKKKIISLRLFTIILKMQAKQRAKQNDVGWDDVWDQRTPKNILDIWLRAKSELAKQRAKRNDVGWDDVWDQRTLKNILDIWLRAKSERTKQRAKQNDVGLDDVRDQRTLKNTMYILLSGWSWSSK
jgi:hypothetical protein